MEGPKRAEQIRLMAVEGRGKLHGLVIYEYLHVSDYAFTAVQGIKHPKLVLWK